MSGYATSQDGSVHAEWERFVRFSHRYVLPVGAAASVAFAAAIATDRLGPLVAYTPVVLAAVGVGTLATSLAYHRVHRPRPAVSTDTLLVPPFSSPESPAPADPASSGRSPEDAAVSGPPPTPRAPPVAAWSVGDELWSHWLVPQSAGLPSELVGPIAASAWAPRGPGHFVAFADREPTLTVSNGRLTPLATPEAPVPAPAPDPTPDYDAVAAAVAALTPLMGLEGDDSASGDVRAVVDRPSGVRTALPPPDPFSRSGAISAGGPLADAPARPAGPRRPFSADLCASCGESIGDASLGHPCPECDQPVCSRCRRMAVIQYGQTWCVSCATQLGWPELATAA